MSGSCADILAHRDAPWTFVTREGVEPTNNHAELELREFVMTVVRTARKQGKAVLDFLVCCVTAYAEGLAPPPLLAAGGGA